MRITNSILARNTLLSIRQGMAGLDEAQQRVASGMRLQRPSDDPAAAADVLGTDRRLRALDQYQRNIGAALSRVNAQESAIDQTSDILSRARELAVGQANGTANAQTRQIAAAEVSRLLESVIALGNTHFGNGYLFGGDAADRAPFSAGGGTDPVQPPTGEGQTEIAAAHTIATTLDGTRTFVNSGAISALQRLHAALLNDDVPEITGAADDLTRSFDAMQTLLGEVGARVNQLELARSNAEALDTSLRAYRADLAEIDIEEAITTLMTKQTTLQAALSSTARLLTTTLTDYLR